MKSLLLAVIIALLFYSPDTEAQVWSSNNLFFEIGFGADVPMGEDLREVFPVGVNTRLGLGINTYKHRLYLKPNGGISFFNHYYSVSGQETLMQWNLGLDARYYLRTLSDTIAWNFYPTVGISYSGFSNTIGPQPGYTGGTSYMTNGKGLTYMAGAGFLYRRFHLEIAYNWYTPTVSIDSDLETYLNSNSGIYQPYTFKDTRMDLSRICLELGVCVPIR